MRTRWRAWTIRTAVVAVITAVATVAIATPAQAARPRVFEFSLVPASGQISAGQQLKARFKIQMNDFAAGVASYTVTSSRPDKLRCISSCGTQNMQVPADGVPVEAVFETVGFFPSDEHLSIEVTTTNTDGNDSLDADVTILKTPTIAEVSGRVTNIMTGEPIGTAKIVMTDSIGTRWEDVASDDEGNFIITKDLYGKDIAAGFIVLEVSKDGFNVVTRQIEANQPKTNLRLQLSSNASATPTTSAPPITASLDTTDAGSQSSAAGGDAGLSAFSLMLIIVGGLLVLLGIGAIVLLFVRRGNDDDYGPPRPGKGGRGGPPPPGRGPTPGQRRPGGPPDRTAPMRPGYGPPRPGAPGRDQTTIARSPLADNPTQHGRRPAGPAQPPYSGPPAPPPPGYGPPTQGGGGQPGGYGPQQTYGGQPQGYGGQPPGHGPEPRQGGGRPTGEGRRVDWMDDY